MCTGCALPVMSAAVSLLLSTAVAVQGFAARISTHSEVQVSPTAQ